MALVTVFGDAWDFSGAPIPAAQEPRLWFSPTEATIGPGLLADVESRATLADDGAFSVALESLPNVLYTPRLDFLIPGQETEPPEKRARGYVEWPTFHPGAGGDIGDLSPIARVGVMWISPVPPPVLAKDVRWLDTNPESADYGLIKKWV